MNKIFLIIQREYLSRVKKRSFIVMTIIGPVLMAAMIILPAYLADWSQATDKRIAVLDETGWFLEKFKEEDNLTFYYVFGNLDEEKENALSKNGDLLLYIPRTELNIPVNSELYSLKQPGLNVTSYIKSVMKQIVENKKLLASGIDPEIIKSAKVNINLQTIKVEEDGIEKKSNTEVEVGLAIFSGIMIYFFIFMFGVQVLKGVMEEKSNRIVEVIISSVKPFQLMLGKIFGVALVGLTQFLLWIILTLIIVGIFQSGAFTDSSSAMDMLGNSDVLKNAGKGGIDPMIMVNEVIGGINIKVMIFSFIFYFLGGYLLYSSLFAAIGGAIDHDTDSQQFMLPVSIPLIFSIALSGVIVNQPDSTLAIWMSMIPFTSPITMMMRIPFGVPMWQIYVSMGLLVIGFIFTTWIAGKIYKTGILMYGQKVSYPIIWKWLTKKY
ncbi:MAG: ABC transporter permease [Bacteroidetes bacterium]|nr:ABC transporter permease [Bacteroidota bacterium]